MMKGKMIISSIGSASALGNNEKTVLDSIQQGKCNFQLKKLNGAEYPVIPIHHDASIELAELLHQYPRYKRIDRSAQLGILATQKCLEQLDENTSSEWTINAGSSRGATGIWEDYHHEFIQERSVPIKSSPLTTLGNISTHIAQHQKLQGFCIDHSITCGSGLQALANGYAWLKAGLTDHFLAVGTEAPITDFTLAQMVALGIYTNEKDEYPCKPCGLNNNKLNTFLLGEAAVAVALVTKEQPAENDVILAGMGTGSETIVHPASISPQGDAFRISMNKALENAGITAHQVDWVIPHSPGTFQGDHAEQFAIKSVFGEHPVQVLNHKFLTGHTLGASGLLSIELAFYMLTKNISIRFPYPSIYSSNPELSKLQPSCILINSMGFGGNAVSIILSKV
jgi:3-oxoacyl-[acyl-carrier-protein] synthase II